MILESNMTAQVSAILSKAVKYPYDDYIEADNTPSYKGLKLLHLYKTHNEPRLQEWTAETKELFIVIRLSDNFIAIGAGESEYDKELNLKLMGLINKKGEEDITIEEIMNHLEINIPKDYYEFV